jgi:peptidoglycan-associated lipoprotein
MAGGTRSARLAFGSIAIVLTLTGCAGRSWQFWKSSPATESTTAAKAAPAEPVAAEPTRPNVGTTGPATAPEPVATASPASANFVEFPTLPDIHFGMGLVTVGKADAAALDGVVRWLKENPGSLVRIEGHTDDLGTPAENLAVGQRRAAAVMRYLVAKGLDPARISIVSYGSDRPVCAEKTTTCRAHNRRAHFLVKSR